MANSANRAIGKLSKYLDGKDREIERLNLRIKALESECTELKQSNSILKRRVHDLESRPRGLRVSDLQTEDSVYSSERRVTMNISGGHQRSHRSGSQMKSRTTSLSRRWSR